MTDVHLTAAQQWALEAFVSSRARDGRIRGAASLGEHMPDRPGYKNGRGQHLHTSQGYGRMGARMARLLADKGLIQIGTDCTGMLSEYKLTERGRRHLRDGKRSEERDGRPRL